MPVACFLGPLTTVVNSRGLPQRSCAVAAPDVECRWVEGRGQWFVAVVNAPAARLTALAGLPGVLRVPKGAWDESLADLTAGQRTALTTALGTMGFTAPEVAAKLPNGVQGSTVGDVIATVVASRKRVRNDNGTVVADGADVTLPSVVAREMLFDRPVGPRGW